jgi:hypothetical protein
MAQRERADLEKVLGGLGALGAPIRSLKLGPSVVAVLATLGAFGLVAIGFATYMLSAQPIYALGVDALIGLFVWALVRMLLQFSHDNPLVAALSGGQVLQYLEASLGAKNPTIVIEHQKPVAGEPSARGGSGDA